MSKKTVALLLALVLVFGAAVGGTLAWLTDTTAEVENTFTVGNIDIDLTEEEEVFKMVPGAEIDKTPIVTVKANSEACWVFVKVDETANVKEFLSYAIDSAWTELQNPGVTPDYAGGTAKVYYRSFDETVASELTLHVLGADPSDDKAWAADQVLVKPSVTKEMLDGLYKYEKNDAGEDVRTDEPDPAKLPKLTFQAYAVQKDGFDTAAAAWEEASK